MENFRFNRLFSTNFFKSLKLKLSEMVFSKDFINTQKGDMYPILSKSDNLIEEIISDRYYVKSGSISRFFCQFFPFATYEINILKSEIETGFEFKFLNSTMRITISGDKIRFTDEDTESFASLADSTSDEKTLIVTCRPKVFDVYQLINQKPVFLATFKSDKLCDMNKEDVFSKTAVCLYCNGETVIKSVKSYLDSGISVADIRPIKYENGDIIYENGKIYLTASIRLQEEMYQGVLAWVPGTCQFELCGAIFYNCGDGYIYGDVAASLKYDRCEKMWYLWVCAFSHGHVLAHAKFEGEPRFGVNIIDIEVMDFATENDNYTSFLGFEGDEDPDFYFDEDDNKWYMAICRLFYDGQKHYRYVFFESDNPFYGYKYIGTGINENSAETGGSFITIKGKKYFACGNSFTATSDYRIYGKDGMSKLTFDYPDGGFRGWGSIIPVKMGTRTRYFHITFDRHGGSNYAWSYGNLYVFEMSL